MSRNYFIEKAAQAWCAKATEHLEMSDELCKRFAEILEYESERAFNGGELAAYRHAANKPQSTFDDYVARREKE